MIKLHPAVATLALLGGVLVSCSSGGDAAPSNRPTVDPALILTSGNNEPSERQLEMLADGEVTFQEYEEAFFAYVQCADDAGIGLRSEPQLDAHGLKYSATFRGAPDIAQAEANLQKLSTCEEIHLLSVLRLWDETNRPSEALLQEAEAAATACVAEGGVEIPPHLSFNDFGTLVAAVASGETRLPSHLSLDDIQAVIEAFPDPSLPLLLFFQCREMIAAQYPVGW
jgi:hypothetical protein